MLYLATRTATFGSEMQSNFGKCQRYNIFFLRIIRIKQIFSYLCTQVMQMNNKIVNIVLAVIAVCLLALCVARVMNVK